MKESSKSELMKFLLPDDEVRQASLSMFAEAIHYANAFGSNKWGVYYASNEDRLRLLVGSFIVFTIHKGATWLALDEELLGGLNDKRSILERSSSWEWDSRSYPRYTRIPSRNGYYIPSSDHANIWPVIRRFHFEFLAKVARKYQWLRADSQNKHSSDWLDFISRELNQYIPTPDYNNPAQAVSYCSPDEIDTGEKYFEGGTKQVLVNAYERDAKARKKCIDHYGAVCVVCDFNFAEFYGEVGNGYIHVHHLFQLSARNQEYEVDPIRDLRPVCPNCHAMIHRRKLEPYTIDQVKEFIAQRKMK